MNRKLEINISSDHDEYRPQEHSEEEEEEEGEEGEQQQEEDEEEYQANQQDQFEQDQENQHFDQSGTLPKQGLESVQTFGNHQPTSTDRRFIDRLLNPHSTSPYLDETPIEQRLTSYRQKPAENSTLQDEINRIIIKVNQRHKNNQLLPLPKSGHRVEEKTRVQQINKRLMYENIVLIGQMNEMEKKLESVYGSKAKKSKESPLQELSRKLKKYKEKLSKAQMINSKLSSRLYSEKSKSQAISNTLNQPTSSLSTLRSRVTSSEGPSKLGPNYCERCCKQLRNGNYKEINSISLKEDTKMKKQLMFSPVLQVKNYEIGAESKEFELSKKLTKDIHCQVSHQEKKSRQDELRIVEEEERALQSLIEANNRKIVEYQEMLYRLVDLQ